jgi:hypothetical protein
MNRVDISQAISQIDLTYIQEAMEVNEKISNRNTKRLTQRLHKVCKLAACICVGLLATSLITVTAFATSETFRDTVTSLLYPIYSSDEIVELDNGHMAGSFDEQDTLLSFLDRFNAEKMEFGVQAENNAGYSYSLLSSSPDNILAIVQCNISNYKLFVTMERLDYEDTTGIWQVISYQMITDEEAAEITERVPEYVPDVLNDSTVNTNPTDSIIEAEGSCAVICNANDKDHVVTLTEQESRQIKEIFEKYPEADSITAVGLQDIVIKYEDVMYAFSTEGYVLVMDGSEISTPRAQIVLSSQDLETLLNIFSNYGI